MHVENANTTLTVAAINSGAIMSFLSINKAEDIRIRNINSTLSTVEGTATVKVQLGDNSFTTDFLVKERCPYNVILGHSFLNTHQFAQNPWKRCLKSISGVKIPYINADNTIHSNKDITIPGQTEMLLQIIPDNPIRIAREIGDKDTIQVFISNLAHGEIKIRKNQAIEIKTNVLETQSEKFKAHTREYQLFTTNAYSEEQFWRTANTATSSDTARFDLQIPGAL